MFHVNKAQALESYNWNGKSTITSIKPAAAVFDISAIFLQKLL